MKYETRPNSIEQGWRALLAKVITQAIKDARRGSSKARDFLHSEGCRDLLRFFIRNFTPNMIDEVLLSGEKELSYKEVA